MAGWDAFPIVEPNDPWARFPKVEPSPTTGQQPTPPPAPAEPMRVDGTDARNDYLDLPVPGSPAGEQYVEPSLVDQIMGGATYGAGSVNQFIDGLVRGAANVAGLPVDIINAAPVVANLLPGVDNVGPISDYPIGGSQSLYDAARLGGLFGDVPEPVDAFQRILNRTGQELGAAAVPVGGALGAAARVGQQGAKELPALARMFVEPAAVNPGKFVQKEATVATGAGLGAGGLNEVTGNQDQSNALIDAGGAIGGAAVTGIGGSLLKSGTDIARALFGNGSYADEVVKDAVMRRVAEAAGVTAAPGAEPDLSPLIQQIEQNPRVSDVIPGFVESVADRTKNPGLAALEYSRQGGPNAGTFTQTRANNTAAIDAAFDDVAPDPNATPGQFSGELALERDRRLTDAAVNTQNAQDAFTRATQGLQPLMTAEGRGAGIRAALEDASDAAKEILSQAWRPINESTQQVDVGPLERRFAAVTADQPMANQRFVPREADIPGRLMEPGEPSASTGVLDASGNMIMRPGSPPDSMQPLNEITAIRSSLTDILRDSSTTPKARGIAEQYLAQLDDYMANNLPEDLRRQYADARAATVDFNDRFTRPQTAIGQVLDTREGRPRYPDSTVAQRFVQSDQGRISDFEALMREAGNDARVQSGVRDQILHDVQARGLLGNPQALNDYLAQYGTIFQRFPQLRSELGSAGALRTRLTEAEAAETQLRDTLTKQGKGAVANYLSYADENADKAMKGVLASREPGKAIDELLTFVNDDPKAVEGARKVFWNILQEKSRSGGRTTMNIDGRQPWSPYALNDFLNDPVNSAVAERLYRNNPEHLARIREIAEAIKGVDTRNAAKAPNTSGTPQGAFSQLLSPETLQSRFYAYRSGKISGSFLITAIASTLIRRGVRKAQETGFQKMLDDVLQNADTAALLMKQNNPANRAALARKAKLWFGNEASTIVNALSADDEPDDTTAAALRPEALN